MKGHWRKEGSMIYIREFEFYNSDGCMLAVPCDMDGGTFGATLEEAAESAADWLFETITDHLIANEVVPGGKLGHEPVHNGKVIAIAVNASLGNVDAMTAADAARMLGVSTARVAQMCASGKLASWKDGSKRMVARRSVEARLAEAPAPGRPKKAAQPMEA